MNNQDMKDDLKGLTPEERVKIVGSKMTDTWRKKTVKEFFDLYGHWYYFTGVPSREKKNWIEQYRKEGV